MGEVEDMFGVVDMFEVVDEPISEDFDRVEVEKIVVNIILIHELSVFMEHCEPLDDKEPINVRSFSNTSVS